MYNKKYTMYISKLCQTFDWAYSWSIIYGYILKTKWNKLNGVILPALSKMDADGDT